MRLDEFKWNRLLPYDRGSEDAEFEQTLVTQLRLCILGSDYRAVSALLSQFDSNYNVLSLPLRIHTSRILYELATTQTLDPTLMRVSTTILTRTLGREEQLTIDDLALDWRKLYDLVRSLVFPKVWQDNPLQRR
ncbi:hypothetical protein GGI04_003026 [Coemansia thaxteri]|nr:hypothetical protein GGI04_003026 [Coemansia thaxteri]